MASKKLNEIKKLLKLQNLKTWIGHYLHQRQETARSLSLGMGCDENFIYRRTLKGDMSGAELVLIGNELNTNPFELYLPLLHETCRPTARERQLEAENLALASRLTELEKERDWLKEVVVGKK